MILDKWLSMKCCFIVVSVFILKHCWGNMEFDLIQSVVCLKHATFSYWENPLRVLPQVCNSVFNSWDQFKDHLVSHTGVKPYHCTMCDMWFTHTKDLRTHLKVVHAVEDSKSAEEVIISDSAASATLAIATQSIAGTETVLLDGGIQVEHVTVEPVDIMDLGGATTVVVEDEEVAEMCEEDVERLQQAGVQIQVVRVTTGEMEQTVVNSQVEVEVEEEMVNVEDAEQAVVWEYSKRLILEDKGNSFRNEPCMWTKSSEFQFITSPDTVSTLQSLPFCQLHMILYLFIFFFSPLFFLLSSFFFTTHKNTQGLFKSSVTRQNFFYFVFFM